MNIRSRNIVIIQSYEEVRFLLELILNEEFPKINYIYVYGNKDLFSHLSKLFEKNQDIKIILISPFPTYQNVISNICPFIGSMIFYKNFFLRLEIYIL